jgi:hypothetical protein
MTSAAGAGSSPLRSGLRQRGRHLVRDILVQDLPWHDEEVATPVEGGRSCCSALSRDRCAPEQPVWGLTRSPLGRQGHARPTIELPQGEEPDVAGDLGSEEVKGAAAVFWQDGPKAAGKA